MLDVLALLWHCLLPWLFASAYDRLDNISSPLHSVTTAEYLTNFLHISKQMRENFLVPFFEAIFVSPIEAQNAAMFEFVLRNLALGRACLPRRGMRAVPEQLGYR